MEEEALRRRVELGLDTIQQTWVSEELKRTYSNYFLSEMVDYAVPAALLKNAQSRTMPQQKELERGMAKCIEGIRNKILSSCASKKVHD